MVHCELIKGELGAEANLNKHGPRRPRRQHCLKTACCSPWWQCVYARPLLRHAATFPPSSLLHSVPKLGCYQQQTGRFPNAIKEKADSRAFQHLGHRSHNQDHLKLIFTLWTRPNLLLWLLRLLLNSEDFQSTTVQMVKWSKTCGGGEEAFFVWEF